MDAALGLGMVLSQDDGTGSPLANISAKEPYVPVTFSRAGVETLPE